MRSRVWISLAIYHSDTTLQQASSYAISRRLRSNLIAALNTTQLHGQWRI